MTIIYIKVKITWFSTAIKFRFTSLNVTRAALRLVKGRRVCVCVSFYPCLVEFDVY